MMLTHRQDRHTGKTDKVTRTCCVPLSLTHVWLQLPVKQALSCCSSQQATYRQSKNQCCSKLKQPALNCSGPASASPQLPRCKSVLQSQPSAAPSVSHPMSHNPPSAGTSPNLLKRDLLFYEAARSLRRVTGIAESPVFQHTRCCHCPRSETVLAWVSHHVSLCRAGVEASGTR